MFLRQIVAVFLVLTSPASSIANPQAMNITTRPFMRKEKLLNTKADSGSTAARAGVDATAANPSADAVMIDFRNILSVSP